MKKMYKQCSVLRMPTLVARLISLTSVQNCINNDLLVALHSGIGCNDYRDDVAYSCPIGRSQ